MEYVCDYYTQSHCMYVCIYVYTHIRVCVYVCNCYVSISSEMKHYLLVREGRLRRLQKLQRIYQAQKAHES